ncbi:hypothetical protein T01_10946, partial [Trichinella spiralis]
MSGKTAALPLKHSTYKLQYVDGVLLFCWRFITKCFFKPCCFKKYSRTHTDLLRCCDKSLLQRQVQNKIAVEEKCICGYWKIVSTNQFDFFVWLRECEAFQATSNCAQTSTKGRKHER